MVGSPIVVAWIAANKSPDSPYYNKEDPASNDTYKKFEHYEGLVKALREKGLKKAYVHLDGWGNEGFDNRHPCPLPPHQRAGGYEGMKKLMETIDSYRKKEL